MDLGDLKFPEYSESAELFAYMQERTRSGDEWAKQFLALARKVFVIGKSPILEWPDVTSLDKHLFTTSPVDSQQDPR